MSPPNFEWILSLFSHFSTQKKERSILNKILDWIILRTNGRTSETLRGHQSVTYTAWRDLYQVLARFKNKNFLFAGSFLVCGKKCTRMAPEVSLCSRLETFYLSLFNCSMIHHPRKDVPTNLISALHQKPWIFWMIMQRIMFI